MIDLSLLFDTRPLVVNPVLAKLIGLNESIVLQQIHYWLEINRQARNNLRDDYYWTYNTFVEWQEQFPFWSLSTIKRTMQTLERSGLIITGNYNRLGLDRTKWYRVDYDKLNSITEPQKDLSDLSQSPLCQNDPSIGSNCTIHSVNLTPAIPETTTETTTDTITITREEKSKSYPQVTHPFQIPNQPASPEEGIKYFLMVYRLKNYTDHKTIKEPDRLRVKSALDNIIKAHDLKAEQLKQVVDAFFVEQPKGDAIRFAEFLEGSEERVASG